MLIDQPLGSQRGILFYKFGHRVPKVLWHWSLVRPRCLRNTKNLEVSVDFSKGHLRGADLLFRSLHEWINKFHPKKFNLEEIFLIVIFLIKLNDQRSSQHNMFVV